MYSSRTVSFFYIFVALLVTMTQLVSATPIEPDRTVGDVVAEDQNRACRMGECYIKNGSVSTGAVDASSATASSALSTPIPVSSSTTNGAINIQPAVMFPAMIAGTSLLLLL